MRILQTVTDFDSKGARARTELVLMSTLLVAAILLPLFNYTSVHAVADTYPNSDAVDCNDEYTDGDPYNWCIDGSRGSTRGYDYRNCTDWAAWRVHELTGVTVPRGLHDGGQWATKAEAKGYSVDATPEVGDVAVWESGNFGHVAVVESVNSDDTVNISEYNWSSNNNGVNGLFGQRNNVTADKYIDFNGVGIGGNSSGSSGGALVDSLLVHRTASSGSIKNTYDINSNGSMPTLTEGAFGADWTHILPNSQDSDDQSELFLYNKDTGATAMYNVTESGGLSPGMDVDNLIEDIEFIVPVQADTDSNSEFFFFDTDTNAVRLYNLWSNGNWGYISGTSWGANWTSVQAVEIDGDDRSELMAHHKSAGLLYFFDIEDDGSITTLSSGSVATTWDMIVPVTDKNDSTNLELLYFRNLDRLWMLREYGTTGSLLQTKSSSTLGAEWSHMVPVNADGDARSEVFVYNESTGARAFLNISDTGSVGSYGNNSFAPNIDHFVPIQRLDDIE